MTGPRDIARRAWPRGAIALVAVVAVLGFVLVFGRAMGRAKDARVRADVPREPSSGGSGGVTSTSAASTERAAAPQDDRETHTISPDELAPSLRGTEIDGGFDLGSDGHVIFGPSLVQLFDYLRATLGEATEDEIRAFLERLARARLGHEEDVARVLSFYDRYVTMLDEAEDRLQSAGHLEDDPEGALDLLHAIRVSAFGEEDAARAFGESEREARGLLARARVQGDPSLSAADRERELAAIAETVPDSLAESWRATGAPLRLRERVAALRAAGATSAEVQALRVAEVGPEAASRLAALDAARQAWAARVAEYRSALDALRAGTEGAPSAAAVAALRGRYFDGAELVRIAALDRVELHLDL